MTRRVAALVLAVLTLAGCAESGSRLQIGFKRIALDLAFKDGELTPKLDPQVVVRQVLSGMVIAAEEPLEPRVVRSVRVPPVKPVTPCVAAPAGQAPERPAFAVVGPAPAPGRYRRRNEGTISLEAATRTIEVPVPPRSTVEVSPVRTFFANTLTGEEAAPVDLPENADSAEPIAKVHEFSITRRLLPGRSVTDVFRYTNDRPSSLEVSPSVNGEINGGRGTVDADYLYLVRRVTIDAGEEATFQPSPPIRYLRLNVPEGPPAESGVSHAGLDSRSQVAMTVTSRIVQREVVDVCGEVLDTYRVEIQEQLVDLAKTPPEVSGNEGTAATYWNVQFDNGLLIVREQVDTVLRTTTEVLGQRVPVVARFRYTSTLERTTPELLA